MKSGLGGSFLPVKDIILIVFKFFYFFVWFLCFAHTLTAYLNTESKIARYTAPRSYVLAWYLDLASKPQLLLSLVFIWFSWKFQVRCSSRYIPKYLALFTGFIFLPLILKFSCFVILLFLGLKIISSVLFALREIQFALSHCTIWERSWLMYLLIFLRDLLQYNIFESLTKWCIKECVTASCRSLIYTRNNKGPKIDPCGTP